MTSASLRRLWVQLPFLALGVMEDMHVAESLGMRMRGTFSVGCHLSDTQILPGMPKRM